ncbi:MAG TPA: hypothetical protein VJ499_12770, partial [Flavisolibacter sp.]|nr:hypothetical protein [Flavisolibacter sp.]
MQLLKLNKALLLCLVFLLWLSAIKAQEVVNNVSIEKENVSLFTVRYKLNRNDDSLRYQSIQLKIYRKRNEEIDEVFSKTIVTDSAGIQAEKTYSYSWKPATGTVKNGDELQAKVVVNYEKPLAKVEVPPLPLNVPPKADAGGDISIQLPLNLVVILDGIRSYDEDGKIIAVQWRQLSGPNNLNIASPRSYKSYVTGNYQPGIYTFELAVTDDKGARTTDLCTISVKAASTTTQPLANGANTIKKKDSLVARKPVQYEMPPLKGGPGNALVNILLPGLGHYFVSGDHYGNDRNPKVFIVTALYAGSIGGAVYYKLKSNSEYKKYLQLAQYREFQLDTDGNIIGVRGYNQAE